MSAKPRTLLVIGSGPGNGIHVAIAFGKRDFSNIILLSRNEERLERDKQQLIGSIGNRDVNVTTQQVDITNDTMLRSVLAHIVDSTTVDCVYFNAARVEPSEMFDFPVEEIRRDFDVSPHACCFRAPTLTESPDHSHCVVYNSKSFCSQDAVSSLRRHKSQARISSDQQPALSQSFRALLLPQRCQICTTYSCPMPSSILSSSRDPLWPHQRRGTSQYGQYLLKSAAYRRTGVGTL